ncbi:Glutamate receptor 1 [Eumeta japonica]|uniref:Glutamate receptor 1 n=1 Tax=Eumeta variegata TaxID=151549 RepID=A0A4C1SLM6_EUMVA|nr:Glutamate receptor 1 [Eumeta japonica]
MNVARNNPSRVFHDQRLWDPDPLISHQSKLRVYVAHLGSKNTVRIPLHLDSPLSTKRCSSCEVCNQFARGVFAMLGAVTPDSFDTLHSYTNTFPMPFVTPWFPEKVIPPSSGLIDHALSLRPDYHRAVIDTITFYGWKNVIYVYDSHDGTLPNSLKSFIYANGGGSVVKRVAYEPGSAGFDNDHERIDRRVFNLICIESLVLRLEGRVQFADGRSLMSCSPSRRRLTGSPDLYQISLMMRPTQRGAGGGAGAGYDTDFKSKRVGSHHKHNIKESAAVKYAG